ncbi:hypothetical protein OG818_30225 [Streptomyces virginiae]|uniref:hypothetical protein n=1 Tax=Streptomyces virginiae TaxID=1961 RepID=UPI00225826E1|nr:hypothetical protein [Streptomyces virginiae]MCX4720002.1 hypothetical protein [Streptomyces virginiae]
MSDNLGSERDRSSWARRHSWRNWNTLERVLAGLAALIAVITGAVVTVKHFTKETPLETEQALLQELRPGETFTRATEIMKEKPHYRMPLLSGNVIYQYDRDWERVQLLVNPTGEVLSVGVFVHDVKFQPKIRIGARDAVLNRDTFAELGLPGFAFGSCGAHSSSYHEAYPNVANAGGGGSFAVGVTDSHRGELTTPGGCAVPLDRLECVQSSFEEVPATTEGNAECLDASRAADFRKSLKVNSVIVSRESNLSSDMFQNPYVVSRGN